MRRASCLQSEETCELSFSDRARLSPCALHSLALNRACGIACSLTSNESKKIQTNKEPIESFSSHKLYIGCHEPLAIEIIKTALIKVYYNKTYLLVDLLLR